MRSSTRPHWHLVVLGLVAVGLVLAAVLEVGPASSSARTSNEVVAAENGVVQSTVTGSGNVEPGTEVFANFKTSGTLSQVYVHIGQHVHDGQLLATLDPTSAQLAVDQTQLSLKAAEDQLTAAQDGGSGSGSGSATSTDGSVPAATTEFVSTRPRAPGGSSQTTSTSTSTTTTPSSKAKKPTRSKTRSSSARSSSAGSSSGTSSSNNTTTTTAPSPAAIASAQAAVDSAQLNLNSAQATLAETRLYAPAGGTIVSLESTSPGDTVSAASSSSSSASTGSGSGSGSGSTGSTGSGSGSGAAASSGSLGGSSSSSSSSSGSGFAEIVDTSSMTMTVAFSESDITKVRVGQPATVSLDALSGVQLAAHVSSISTLGTTSDGVVSYDATLDLDQTDSSVRPGMSASASVVTAQAQGVNLPNSAVSGTGSVTTVNLLRNGKSVPTPVAVGLRGDSRTQIVSGLRPGQQVVVTTPLPALGAAAASSGTSAAGTGFARRFGSAGLGALGGGGGALGGGGARFFGGG